MQQEHPSAVAAAQGIQTKEKSSLWAHVHLEMAALYKDTTEEEQSDQQGMHWFCSSS